MTEESTCEDCIYCVTCTKLQFKKKICRDFDAGWYEQK